LTDQRNQNTPLYVRRHLQFGWWSLLCFLSLGIMLEMLWGFRADWYVKDEFFMRRLLWTLGHAHGALFGLIHVAYALTMNAAPDGFSQTRRISSPCLVGASILMPGGFFLGGIFLHGQGGDPGMGVFLSPVGALLLFVAVLLSAIAVTSFKESNKNAKNDNRPKGR